MGAFLRAGIDVCSTAMTPWVWPHMTQNPPSWIDPITEACAAGGASCFTTGIDPGFANDLFPMTLMGLCSEVRQVRALEILDYINYEGDYEVEMGIGMPPDYTPMLEHTEILAMSWGGDRPDDGPRRRRRARRHHLHVGEVGHPGRHHHGQGRHRARATWPPSGSPSTGSSAASPGSASSTSTGSARTPRPTGPGATRTTSTGW